MSGPKKGGHGRPPGYARGEAPSGLLEIWTRSTRAGWGLTGVDTTTLRDARARIRDRSNGDGGPVVGRWLPAAQPESNAVLVATSPDAITAWRAARPAP